MDEFGLDFEVFLLLAIGEVIAVAELPPLPTVATADTAVKLLLSMVVTFPSGLPVLLLLFEMGSWRVDTMLEFHNEGPPIE